MKALFITHDVGIYGAQRSLQLLISNFKNATISVIVPKKFPFQRRNDFDEIKKSFGSRVVSIKEFYLPRHLCYDGRSTGLLTAIRGWIRSFFWFLEKRKLYSEIENGGYDFIHLNSVVLNPIIEKGYPLIIHIREIVDDFSPSTIERIRNAAGVVFIDESTKAALDRFHLSHAIVLNNPFDMTKLTGYSPLSIGKEYGIDIEDKIVLSLIGSLQEVKGVDFIIQSFKKTRDDRLILLVVGSGKPSVVREYKNLAGDDSRIRFLGEEKDIFKIYSISDYILRGDPTFRIGRTIFEGLYADCDVIIPGERKEAEANPELMRFWDKVHLYPPRDEENLSRLLEGIAGRKITKKNLHSNTEDYVARFEEFIKKTLMFRSH